MKRTGLPVILFIMDNVIYINEYLGMKNDEGKSERTYEYLDW